MNSYFLFWLFFVGLIVATCQDLKRREVDNWLNLFLLIFGLSYLFLKSFFEKTPEIIFITLLLIVIVFILMNLFYYGRVFAGGDAKLLFAMTPLFVAGTFFSSLINLGVFVLLLMVSGSFYGLSYSIALYIKNFKEVNKQIRGNYLYPWIRYIIFLGVVITLFGFGNPFWFLIGGFVFSLPLLFILAKGLEKVVMVKTLSGKELREGDWLVKDVKVKGKTIKADWDGLSKEDLVLMKDLKKVKIKDGLPFVPAFLIAFILYFVFENYFAEILRILI